MKIDLNLNSLVAILKKYYSKLAKHGVFLAVLTVLIAYVLVVWQISNLTNSEVSENDVTAAETANNIPKVNKTAVKQIQSLEQSNTNVQSLFDTARNNPFQE